MARGIAKLIDCLKLLWMTEVKKSASKMMNSAVFGQIIILIVYLPILTLQGIEGKMFKPMAQTVAFAFGGVYSFPDLYSNDECLVFK
jgi:hypothetical protein